MKFLTIILSASIFAFSAQAEGFKLTSIDISEGEKLSSKHVFKGFSCEGENISPDLSWSGAPVGTKSFVITAYDPDAPTGSGWWHWGVANIPASVSNVKTGETVTDLGPSVFEIRNDYGSHGFGGACPPPGEMHRYVFTVYALKTEKLPAGKTASAALIGYLTKANALASTKITAVYWR
ncbi:MAG: YbhB/YbcL family Raf kinase inhibitor-like protein [Sneathiellales bacterium]|nr:YbhB/YbcL family Raf kinase inhibitor-like protein [Sneathiellales bacterium]